MKVGFTGTRKGFKMKVGFTGTRKGMTDQQKNNLKDALKGAKEFHHGDCIGADAEAVEIAISIGIVIWCHPPLNDSKSAFMPYDFITSAQEYLTRNRYIVDSVDVLYACPDGPEKLRSGTWSTIRYALKRRKKVVIFYPNEASDGNKHRAFNHTSNPSKTPRTI